jgi:hypothetical protein
MVTRDARYARTNVRCFDGGERDIKCLWLKVGQYRPVIRKVVGGGVGKLIEGNVLDTCRSPRPTHREFGNRRSKGREKGLSCSISESLQRRTGFGEGPD